MKKGRPWCGWEERYSRKNDTQLEFTMRLTGVKLGVIGCGNMGEAIIRGVIAKKVIRPNRLTVFDTIAGKLRAVSKRYKVKAAGSAAEAAKASNVIIIAVKPKDAHELFTAIAPFLNKHTLIISIMAGVQLSWIQGVAKKRFPVVRVMPNMAALVGSSISSLSYNTCVPARHKAIARELFSSIGTIYETEEAKKNAVTALVGSGPGFLMYILEAFIEAALEEGFSGNDAHRLLAATFKGTAHVLDRLGLSPEDLRKRVTSKGGTTEAGIRVFERRRLNDIVKEAVRAAIIRAEELGK
ncbi:MAG: pyrroline-5-carboxylate reductase [Candidatus Omnitrophica bacterium]|nr:pyrroline-5-carboxylate reductase [Candidatus Omnitrophota bacterium]